MDNSRVEQETAADFRQPVSRRSMLAKMGMAGVAFAAGHGLRAAPQAEPNRARAGHGIFNVRDFGATGDGRSDDSLPFQAAADAVVAAGKGVLYIPAGAYRFGRRVAVEAISVDLAIRGDGLGISCLYSQNGEGILSFRFAARHSQVTVSNLSFFAPGEGMGTALEIEAPPGGNRHARSLVMENVEARGVDHRRDFFTVGFRTIGQWRPLFSNIIFSGPFGPGASRGYRKDAPIYRADCGIQVDGSYAPSFQHCYMWGAKTLYQNRNESHGPEDTAFYRSFAVEGRVGIDIRTDRHEPQLVIDSCHINCRDVGVRIFGRKFFQVTNCLFYNDDYRTAAPGYRDIEIERSFCGIIAHNIFHQPGNEHREMIVLGDRSVHMTISDNMFNARGVTLTLSDTARDVRCFNNQYTPRITKVVRGDHPALAFSASHHRGMLVRAEPRAGVATGAWTTVKWGETEHDIGGFLAGGQRVVIPEGEGIRFVRISAAIGWTPADGGRRELELLKNGKGGFPGASVASEAPAVEAPVRLQTAVLPVRGGDVFELRGRQTSGRPLELSPGGNGWLSIEVVDG